MATAATANEATSLYRALIRAQRQLPPHEGRVLRFSVYVRNRIRADFRANIAADPATAARLLSAGKEELKALRRLLSGESARKYPLSEGSNMMKVLPSKATFTLLEKETQERLATETTTSFLSAYLYSRIKQKFFS
ncbi:hypothetical protein DFJ73DRAFT_262864 [Zopfochytrium polystomum]|nr:hypothetical protein DFJ73DRAFT_262864 [Zopfochytrium polystomum]